MNRASIAVLGLLLLAGAAGAAEIYPIGTDHPLASDDAVERFQQTGVVRGNLTELDVGLTIAKKHEKADIDGAYVDASKIWVCVDYREQIPRTLRVAVPAGYAQPRPGETDSVTTNHTVSLRPAPEANATSVTIEFDHASRPCFSIGTASGMYFDIKSQFRGWLNATTGLSLPSVAAATDQWQRIPPHAWNGTTQIKLNATEEATIQFDNAPGVKHEWLPVPTCDDPSEQPVCRYQSNNATGGNGTITLLSTHDDPPPVRYKKTSDSSAVFKGALKDIGNALSSFIDDISDLLGGGS